MTCQRIQTQLDDYVDGQLEAGAQAQLERHAAACADCRHTLEEADALKRALAAFPVAGPTDGFFDRALAQAVRASKSGRAARTGRRRLAAALAAGVAALVIAGVLVRAPDLGPASPVADVTMAVHEMRTVHLVFASKGALEDVSLTVELPPGIELASHRGLRQVRWTTPLQAGKNVLPLELVAVDPAGGDLVATLRREDKEKVFTVNIAVVPG